MATTKLKGNEVTLSGTDVKVGDVAPVVTVVAKDLSDVRFICVKNEKLCKIRKRYYSKKRKENSNYGFLSVFFVLIVKNTQKMYFKIMKYIKL